MSFVPARLALQRTTSLHINRSHRLQTSLSMQSFVNLLVLHAEMALTISLRRNRKRNQGTSCNIRNGWRPGKRGCDDNRLSCRSCCKDYALKSLQYALNDGKLKRADYRLIASELERIESERVPYSKILEREYGYDQAALSMLLQSTSPRQITQWFGENSGSVDDVIMFLQLSTPGTKTRTANIFENAWRLPWIIAGSHTTGC